MSITIQGYQQRVATPSIGGTPRLNAARTPDIEVSSSINAAARVLEKIEDDQADAQALQAAAATRMSVEEAYHGAQEKTAPGADGFTPMFMGLYNGEVTKTADGLPSELARKKYKEKMLGFGVSLQDRSLTFEAGERQRFRKQSFENAADASASTLFSTDADNRLSAFEQAKSEIDQSLDTIDMLPDAKAELREKIRTKLSYAAVQGDLRDRPEAVQDWLTKGNGSAYFSKLRATESGGRNIGSDTSSAFGPYQFTEGTWGSLIAKHPDLGLTAKDRFDPISQELGIRAFTEDNAKILKGQGFAATNVNLYMMHFLGEAGGPRFLNALKDKSTRQDPAASHVDAAAVAANGGVFKNGRTVQDVYLLFGQKFGAQEDAEKQGGSPTYYNDLTFQHRNTLYDQADAELRKKRSDGAAAFKQIADNTVAQYAANGFSTDTLGEQQFIAAYGPARGTTAFGEFQAATIGAKAQHDLRTLDLGQHAQYLEGIRPDETDPYFAEKLKGFEQAKQASNTIRNAVSQDAAGYVSSYNPAVQQQLAAVANAEGSDDAKRGEAVSTYLVQLNQEYDRLGVPQGMRRTIPKAYADTLTASLSRAPTDNVGATAIWRELTRQRQAWGSEWPSVLRELGDSSSDIRVIGSGISEEAAGILISNRKTSVSELTKVLPAGSSKLIDSELQGVFTDYARSLRLPGEDGSAFFAAAQKLAAVKMRDSVNADRASEWAYDQLIGSKYSFEGEARLPKDQANLAYVLDDAKRQALETVDLSSLPPGVTLPDAKAWYASSTRWVTLPDDSGLILMEGARAVRGTDGRAIARDWKALQAMPQPDPDAAFLELLSRQGQY